MAAQKIAFRLQRFADLEALEVRSQPFGSAGTSPSTPRWQLLVYPHGNNCRYLSVYLEVADADALLTGWARPARFTLSVDNHLNAPSVSEEFEHVFTADAKDFGARELISLRRLHDPREGFLAADGSLRITCFVEVLSEGRRAADARRPADVLRRESPVQLAELADELALARATAASARAAAGDVRALDELACRLSAAARWTTVGDAGSLAHKAPALDAFLIADHKADRARAALEAAQGRLRRAPTDAAARAARDALRDECIAALTEAHRAYRADLLRREEHALQRDADAMSALLREATHALSAGHPSGLSSAEAEASSGRAEAGNACAEGAEDVTAACAAAAGAHAFWKAALGSAPAHEQAADDALRAAWSTLSALGSSAGGSRERAAWASACARARDAIDAELQLLRAPVAHPLAGTERPPLALLAPAAEAAIALLRRYVRSAGLARERARAARAEADSLRSAEADGLAAVRSVSAAKEARLRAQNGVWLAQRAEADAKLSGGDAALSTRQLREAWRHLSDATRAVQEAHARLIALADGPLPELQPQLPDAHALLEGVPAALHVRIDGSIEQHYELIQWPSADLEPTAARHAIRPCRLGTRAVVLKEFSLAVASQQRALRREAEVLSRIAHPHILKLEAVVFEGCHASRAHAQFALCAGGMLRSWLSRPEQTPPADAVLGTSAPTGARMLDPLSEAVASTHVRALRQLLAAVAHLHALSICHGDVKLENALVAYGADGGHDGVGAVQALGERRAQPWRVVLADFGLARHVPAEAAGGEAVSSNGELGGPSMTTLMGAGTSGYMAPEVRRGALPTAASDVFAFAVCALLALSADAQTSALIAGSIDGARQAATALGCSELLAALSNEPAHRPRASQLEACSLFDAANALARAQADTRAATAELQCVVCLDGTIGASHGAWCSGSAAGGGAPAGTAAQPDADADAGAHFACDECLAAHVRLSSAPEALCAQSALRCVLGRSDGSGCARSYPPHLLARHVPQDAFEAFFRARMRAEELRISAELERGVDLRIEAEARRISELSLAQRRREELRRHVVERILNLSCPRCSMVFPESLDGELGFAGCCVLQCARAGCNCFFCAYCLADCARQHAHAHVTHCPQGHGLYATREQFQRAQRERRTRMLRAFIAERSLLPADASALLADLSRELRDLGIDARDLGPV